MPEVDEQPTARIVDGRVLNCLPSTDTSDDWTSKTAIEAGVLAAEPLPKEVDLRENWWKIGDQNTTGSCVGWATADGVVRWHMVKSGRARKNQALSVRQVWMSSKEIDEIQERPTSFIERAGTTLKAALDVARKYGVVTAKTLPFNPRYPYLDKSNVFYAEAAKRKISSYFNLGVDLQEWRRWIAENGPLLAALNCDKAWFDCSSADPYLKKYKKPKAWSGHAVAIVGYTEDYFIVRNSWGTEHFGDAGFAYASNDYVEAGFYEAYGVTA